MCILSTVENSTTKPVWMSVSRPVRHSISMDITLFYLFSNHGRSICFIVKKFQWFPWQQESHLLVQTLVMMSVQMETTFVATGFDKHLRPRHDLIKRQKQICPRGNVNLVSLMQDPEPAWLQGELPSFQNTNWAKFCALLPMHQMSTLPNLFWTTVMCHV